MNYQFEELTEGALLNNDAGTTSATGIWLLGDW